MKINATKTLKNGLRFDQVFFCLFQLLFRVLMAQKVTASCFAFHTELLHLKKQSACILTSAPPRVNSLTYWCWNLLCANRKLWTCMLSELWIWAACLCLYAYDYGIWRSIAHIHFYLTWYLLFLSLYFTVLTISLR